MLQQEQVLRRGYAGSGAKEKDTYPRAEELRRGSHGGGGVQRDAGAVDGDVRQRMHAVPGDAERGEGERECQREQAALREHVARR